ncbi:MAG: hypothetical protein QME79_08590 [Bacillota bacterium]|nr:hypothetical protein [Bacillota bacterium]
MRVQVTLLDKSGNKQVFTATAPLELSVEDEAQEKQPVRQIPYDFVTKTAPDQPILIYSDRLLEFR